MKEISFAGRKIAPESPCFIVAEAGVNHNGDVELAKRLVDAAADAGANAVKFQTWVTEKLVAPETRMATYQKQNLGTDESQFEMLKSLELSYDQFRKIKTHAERRGILFFSTPDEEESADFLDQLGVPLFKIGSAEVTNLPFLRHVALKQKPIILSTGMSTLGDVEVAVRTIEDAGNQHLILLQCVSSYPALPVHANLRAMDTLRSAFGYPVGFSDHTLGILVAIAAVARGACVIEKHLTLDKSMYGPDHRASLDPKEFEMMVQGIRTIEDTLGTGFKLPTEDELVNKRLTTKRIFARASLPAGSVLNASMVMLLRSDQGIPANRFAEAQGLVLQRAVDRGQPISWKDLDLSTDKETSGNATL